MIAEGQQPQGKGCHRSISFLRRPIVKVEPPRGVEYRKEEAYTMIQPMPIKPYQRDIYILKTCIILSLYLFDVQWIIGE